MLNSVDIAAELIKRNALLDAQAAAPAALVAEKASQAVIKAPAELIANELAAAKELRELQADAEQAHLDALCIAARNITTDPIESVEVS